MSNKAMEQQENQYNPSEIEPKYQKIWEEKGIYEPDLKNAQKPFYNLMMFPYPSAEGLHIGNMYAFCGADIFGRFKKMQGFSVFEPIGLDGFGIHSENYALKLGEHPAIVAKRTAANFYRQLRVSGNAYSWKHTLETYDPDYYKWTQWIFVQMFKAGLAYKKDAPVNWCPSCKTVLADEQVLQKIKYQKSNIKNKTEDIRTGTCERCGSEVEIKKLRQWFFKITAYAPKLLENLKKLNWPNKVLLGQKNWIGQSQGSEIIFKACLPAGRSEGKDLPLHVFTTRVDTTYGVTALVIAPDKLGSDGKTPLGLELATQECQKEVEHYIDLHKGLALVKERGDKENDKTGVFTGSYAINPFSGERVPIWVANYVVGWYGTGALMVVPAHDERDFEFAKKYKLPVKKVIDWKDEIHSLVMKKSVDPQFIKEVELRKWYWTDYQDFGYGIVIPKKDEEKYIRAVQKYFRDGPWYADCDGAFKAVIFKNKVFSLPSQDSEAKEYGRSVGTPEEQLDWQEPEVYPYCYPGYGVLVNSGEFNGLTSEEAIPKMNAYLEDTGQGKKQTHYKLRDWIISRQRYWGAPIPMIFCASCAKKGLGWDVGGKNPSSLNLTPNSLLTTHPHPISQPGYFPVPEDQLPVLLPEIKDWRPKGTDKSPLASVDEFVYTTCPNCGGPAERETDVCDTFLDSSWYYLRYPSVNTENSKIQIPNSKQIQNPNDQNSNNLKIENCPAEQDLASPEKLEIPWNQEITRRWLPVSQYTGGAEHTVLHLLYSRFVTMALHDMGYLEFDEPFPNFFAHGLIIKEGAKMSKSKGNIVVPDEYIKKYGVDALRCYLMFIGSFDMGGDFRDSGMHGMFKFLKRIWNLAHDSTKTGDTTSPQLKIALHKTIKKVTEDIAKFKYNTSLAFLMEFTNNWECKGQALLQVDLIAFLKLLAPFAPHLTEEIFQKIARGTRPPATLGVAMRAGDTSDSRGTFQSIHTQSWPTYDEALIIEENITIIIQINGKLRAQVMVPHDLSNDREKVIEEALNNEAVKKYITDPLKAKKIIFIPGKLLNFVV